MIFREVILLCDVEDASYREIAEILSIPMGTVMSRLARARKALRESLLSTPGAPGSRDLSSHIETHEDPGATREVSTDQDFAAKEDKLLPLSSRIWRSNPEEPVQSHQNCRTAKSIRTAISSAKRIPNWLETFWNRHRCFRRWEINRASTETILCGWKWNKRSRSQLSTGRLTSRGRLLMKGAA